MPETTMKQTEIKIQRMRLLANRAWLEQNFEEIQNKYSDNWIVVLDKRVVANNQNLEEIRSSSAGREAEAILLLVPRGKIAKPI